MFSSNVSWIPFLSHPKLIIWMWRGMVFSNFKNDPHPLATWIWITVFLFHPSFGSIDRAIDCPLAFRWWNVTIKVDISWTLRYANFTSPCFSQENKKLFHVEEVGMKMFLVRPLGTVASFVPWGSWTGWSPPERRCDSILNSRVASLKTHEPHQKESADRPSPGNTRIHKAHSRCGCVRPWGMWVTSHKNKWFSKSHEGPWETSKNQWADPASTNGYRPNTWSWVSRGWGEVVFAQN